MVTPKRVAYHGRLSKSVTKAVLVISVAGYLSFGGGVSGQTNDTHDGVAKKELSRQPISKKRIAQDDDEVMLIIKAFLECQ